MGFLQSCAHQDSKTRLLPHEANHTHREPCLSLEAEVMLSPTSWAPLRRAQSKDGSLQVRKPSLGSDIIT